ncbi:hypothetical protein N0V88_006541 [Collariella sp. IMI 366227]|nr:hypothetical protein N0V88_006541 [Collariella sp. IMI 366227]
MTTPISAPFSVTVHPFPSSTPYSCAYERGPPSARHALVFIGGLTAGPQAMDLTFIAKVLESSQALDFSLWEFRMRSSYSGFGYSSLANDVEDMAAFVQYLRRIGKEKIVLMGSSTGCQDCLEYTNRRKYQTPSVDGYILMSPISDREAALNLFMTPAALEASILVAKKMIENGQKEDFMPKAFLPPIFTTPITAYRWHSLAAKGGDDDYFSSELPNSMLAATFGHVNKPLLILPSGEDEMVPPTVDRKGLLDRWIAACGDGVASALSELIPGADHVVSQTCAQKWAAGRVEGFLKSV